MSDIGDFSQGDSVTFYFVEGVSDSDQGLANYDGYSAVIIAEPKLGEYTYTIEFDEDGKTAKVTVDEIELAEDDGDEDENLGYEVE